MGVIVLGLSLMFNPIISRFRAVDLMVKFVTFLLLYAFSWTAITLMHGAVNDITMWIRPSPAQMATLTKEVAAISIGAVAAYFAGATSILGTALGLGVQLGMRRVLLLYVFPYIFPALILMLYISPWRRLRSFASVTIWMYVSTLTMVIPMAIFLKAATLVKITAKNPIAGVLILIAIFGAALLIPGIMTAIAYKISGSVAGRVKSAAAGAASRTKDAAKRAGGTAKDKAGWGGSGGTSASTATANTSPGERAEEAVEVSTDTNTGGSGLSSSGVMDGSLEIEDYNTNETTAGRIRALDAENNREPTNPDAQKWSYLVEDSPHRTMNDRLAD
jgi:hypothetical protein